jgi:hypothetical protein
MFVVSLGAASLFAYASNANSNADDRELAMAIAQKRLECCVRFLSPRKLDPSHMLIRMVDWLQQVQAALSRRSRMQVVVIGHHYHRGQ